MHTPVLPVELMRMLGRTKLTFILLSLGCTTSSEKPQAVARPTPEEMVRYHAEQEHQELEDRIRLSVYFKCGSDLELRCQQFAPRTLRGIQPTIPMRSLLCQGTGSYPKRTRSCAFALGKEERQTTTCRITLNEAPGNHAPYWSDELPPEPVPPSSNSSLPSIGIGRSSLTCTGPLLALTDAPEQVVEAPAVPARAFEDLATLITGDDYPIPGFSQGKEGITAMRLQIGSHGRIDRCTITSSSGSEYLDTRACELLRARAHFHPAQGTNGKAVAAEFVHRHRWIPPR